MACASEDHVADRLLFSEREVVIRRGVHAGKYGNAKELVLDALSSFFVVELAGTEHEVSVRPGDLEVTGKVELDFELEAIDDDDDASGMFLCRWMATLMSPDESSGYEEMDYTMCEVSGSDIGRYRVVQWEPTWEATVSEEALATWEARKVMLRRVEEQAEPLCEASASSTSATRPKRLAAAREAGGSCEGGGAGDHRSGHAPPIVVDLLSTDDEEVSHTAFVPPPPALKKRRAKCAIPLADAAPLDNAIPPAAAAPLAAAAPAAPPPPTDRSSLVPAFGAVCTVWRPHLLFAVAAEVHSTPALREFFQPSPGVDLSRSSRSGAGSSAAPHQPRFLWLSVTSGRIHTPYLQPTYPTFLTSYISARHLLPSYHGTFLPSSNIDSIPTNTGISLQVMSDQIPILLRGDSTPGMADAYPGEHRPRTLDRISPSRAPYTSYCLQLPTASLPAASHLLTHMYLLPS